MRICLLILGLAGGLAMVPSVSFGQCRGGVGGATAARGATSTGSGNVALPAGASGSGQLLTGPGSWYYDVMMQQQLQQAMAQQQYAMAVAKAEKAQAKYEVRLANAQKRRAEAAYKLEADRARRSTQLARQ